MRHWQLIGAALFVCVIGLIISAPATLIDARLNQVTAGRLRLAEAQGTLWSGLGQIEMRDAAGRTGVAKSIAWRVLPGYLLRGQLGVEIQLDQSAKRFPVTASLSRVELADAEISLPAAALSFAVPKLAPLGLTGDVLLRIARLSVERTAIRGNATLRWQGAGSSFAPVSPLGDYELRLEGEGAAVRASLSTLQGPLQLDGQGSWAGGGNPVFRATARVPPQHLQQLAPLLRLIAVERGEGRFELQLQ